MCIDKHRNARLFVYKYNDDDDDDNNNNYTYKINVWNRSAHENLSANALG